MVQKIVINTCFGGFGLSYEAMMLYAEKKGMALYAFTEKRNESGHLLMEEFELYVPEKRKPFLIHYSTKPLKNGKYEEKSYFSDSDIPRDDPALVEVVQELKERASGTHAELSIVEIPDDVEWEIEEYDGTEHIAEKHRTWC